MKGSRQKKQAVKMKVCVIGSSGAGKTTFIHRLIQSQLQPIPTEEFQVVYHCVDTKAALLQIQLWDCSGHYQEFHRYLKQAYFRNSSAALLLFDITQKNWQEQAHYWISEAYENQCYLVYAIATRIERYSENNEKSLVSSCPEESDKNISKPFLNDKIEDVRQKAMQLFAKYEIKIHFLMHNESIRQHFDQLFARMHDESLIVARGSIARGLPLPVLLQDPSISESGQLSQSEQSRR